MPASFFRKKTAQLKTIHIVSKEETPLTAFLPDVLLKLILSYSLETLAEVNIARDYFGDDVLEPFDAALDKCIRPIFEKNPAIEEMYLKKVSPKIKNTLEQESIQAILATIADEPLTLQMAIVEKTLQERDRVSQKSNEEKEEKNKQDDVKPSPLEKAFGQLQRAYQQLAQKEVMQDCLEVVLAEQARQLIKTTLSTSFAHESARNALKPKPRDLSDKKNRLQQHSKTEQMRADRANWYAAHFTVCPLFCWGPAVSVMAGGIYALTQGRNKDGWIMLGVGLFCLLLALKCWYSNRIIQNERAEQHSTRATFSHDLVEVLVSPEPQKIESDTELALLPVRMAPS